MSILATTVLAQTPDPHQVFHRLERFYREVASGQIDAAMTLYAPDAQILLPGQAPVKGKVNIGNWWLATLKEYRFEVSPRLIEASDLGDAVMLQGEAVGQLVSRSGGSNLKIDIWFVQIYRKQTDGQFLFWRGASGPNPASDSQFPST